MAWFRPFALARVARSASCFQGTLEKEPAILIYILESSPFYHRGSGAQGVAVWRVLEKYQHSMYALPPFHTLQPYTLEVDVTLLAPFLYKIIFLLLTLVLCVQLRPAMYHGGVPVGMHCTSCVPPVFLPRSMTTHLLFLPRLSSPSLSLSLSLSLPSSSSYYVLPTARQQHP